MNAGISSSPGCRISMLMASTIAPASPVGGSGVDGPDVVIGGVGRQEREQGLASAMSARSSSRGRRVRRAIASVARSRVRSSVHVPATRPSTRNVLIVTFSRTTMPAVRSGSMTRDRSAYESRRFS